MENLNTWFPSPTHCYPFGPRERWPECFYKNSTTTLCGLAKLPFRQRRKQLLSKGWSLYLHKFTNDCSHTSPNSSLFTCRDLFLWVKALSNIYLPLGFAMDTATTSKKEANNLTMSMFLGDWNYKGPRHSAWTQSANRNLPEKTAAPTLGWALGPGFQPLWSACSDRWSN